MIASILFNGIQYPFHLVDEAIGWAKAHHASIRGIFIKSADEVKEGYIFPSDLDAAENLTDHNDTENANVEVIRKNMEILKGAASTAKIDCSTELLTDPDTAELKQLIGDSDRLFVDENFEKSGILKSTSFDLDMLKKL